MKDRPFNSIPISFIYELTEAEQRLNTSLFDSAISARRALERILWHIVEENRFFPLKRQFLVGELLASDEIGTVISIRKQKQIKEHLDSVNKLIHSGSSVTYSSNPKDSIVSLLELTKSIAFEMETKIKLEKQELVWGDVNFKKEIKQSLLHGQDVYLHKSPNSNLIVLSKVYNHEKSRFGHGIGVLLAARIAFNLESDFYASTENQDINLNKYDYIIELKTTDSKDLFIKLASSSKGTTDVLSNQIIQCIRDFRRDFKDQDNLDTRFKSDLASCNIISNSSMELACTRNTVIQLIVPRFIAEGSYHHFILPRYGWHIGTILACSLHKALADKIHPPKVPITSNPDTFGAIANIMLINIKQELDTIPDLPEDLYEEFNLSIETISSRPSQSAAALRRICERIIWDIADINGLSTLTLEYPIGILIRHKTFPRLPSNTLKLVKSILAICNTFLHMRVEEEEKNIVVSFKAIGSAAEKMLKLLRWYTTDYKGYGNHIKPVIMKLEKREYDIRVGWSTNLKRYILTPHTILLSKTGTRSRILVTAVNNSTRDCKWVWSTLERSEPGSGFFAAKLASLLHGTVLIAVNGIGPPPRYRKKNSVWNNQLQDINPVIEFSIRSRRTNGFRLLIPEQFSVNLKELRLRFSNAKFKVLQDSTRTDGIEERALKKIAALDENCILVSKRLAKNKILLELERGAGYGKKQPDLMPRYANKLATICAYTLENIPDEEQSNGL